jgi:hypothetical protein
LQEGPAWLSWGDAKWLLLLELLQTRQLLLLHAIIIASVWVAVWLLLELLLLVVGLASHCCRSHNRVWGLHLHPSQGSIRLPSCQLATAKVRVCTTADGAAAIDGRIKQA